MKSKLLRLSIALMLIAAIVVLPQTPAFALHDLQEPEFKDIRSYNKWLPASLGIEIPNVNPSAIRDDRALNETEIQTAVRFGKTEKEAGMMTCSEFQGFVSSQKLTAQSMKSIAEVFPELSEEQISRMTYRDYENYSYAKTIAALTPDKETLEELNRRGITLDDFIYLRKFYDDDMSILAEDDAVLRSTLKKYYYLKLDYACSVSNDIDYKNVTVPQDEREEHEQMRYNLSNYDQVASFQKYKFTNDYFLKTTNTANSLYRSDQETAALSAYNTIYALTSPNPSSYYYTNMYGTLSQSNGGAHEGIDMVYSTTPDVHSITSGTAYNDSTYNGATRIYNNTYGSAIYAHMTNRVTSGSVAAGGVIGKQGSTGNATGKHVHFEIATTMQSCGDDVLTSSSPYLFMHTYTGHTHTSGWYDYGNQMYHRNVCTFAECNHTNYAYHVADATGKVCTVCGYYGTIIGPV